MQDEDLEDMRKTIKPLQAKEELGNQLENDAKILQELIKGGDKYEKKVVVCAAFELKKKAGHVAYFAFSNLETFPKKGQAEAKNMGYHVVRAQQAHAEMQARFHFL